jgi:restriction endonuclease/response regulator receiver domain-containing protein
MNQVFWLDDDAQYLEHASRGLAATIGLDVRTFTNASALLSETRDTAADALIVDLRLGPGTQDGLDVVRTFRSLDKNLPILVVSGFGGEPGIREKLSALGVPLVLKDGLELDGIKSWLVDASGLYRTELSWEQIRPPLVSEIINASGELLSLLEKDPSLFYALDPFKFEEVVGDIIAKYGFDIEMTGKTWDGGIDFFAIKRDLSRSLYIVQCKRYKREKLVRVGEVRELYGVKTDFQASNALLVTTSYYTSASRKFEEKHKWEIDLKDYDQLVALLRERPR